MGDTKTTLTWLLRDQVSGTAKKVNGELSKLGLTAKKSGSSMGGLGGMLGGLVNPATLAIGAVVGLTAALGSAVKGAIEDEKVLARLDAALKANVRGWDGNRTALDAYINAQVKLGFVDEEVSASMAQLITATGDVAKAQQFQAAAMDLARLKGISLAEATDALTKIEGGSFRILKALGIELPKNATATDALAAVQNAAAGQALAYGNTTAGAMDKINAEMDQLSDEIGAELVPALKALATFFIEVIVPAIKVVIGTVKALITAIQDAVDWIHALTKEADEKFIKPGSKLDQFFQANPAPIPFFGGKAAGGPVSAGGAYTVGEHGPETLVMGGSSGSIVPNGGMGVSIVGVSAAQLADMIDRQLYFRFKRTGLTQRRV